MQQLTIALHVRCAAQHGARGSQALRFLSDCQRVQLAGLSSPKLSHARPLVGQSLAPALERELACRVVGLEWDREDAGERADVDEQSVPRASQRWKRARRTMTSTSH